MDRNFDTRDTEDERTLIARAVDGDGDAFGVLYARHMDAIYRYIVMRIGDTIQAEDLTEEVFVRAWEALPRYRPRQHPFTSWLYRIAHNLVVDTYRKREPLAVPRSDLEVQQASGSSPESLVERMQDLSSLSAAVQQLDDEEQQVILLRFVDNLSHREVGQIIGKSEGASRVVQHRALARLHELLSEQEHPDA